MNTELRERAEALLKDKWAWCPFDPKYFQNFIDVMIDFHNQELSRIGEVYVPVSVENTQKTQNTLGGAQNRANVCQQIKRNENQ